jgi:hypothetical protein
LAYIYTQGQLGWSTSPTVTLTGTDNSYFGESVAMSGDVAVVGAWGTGSRAGAAYIYEQTTSGWSSAPTIALTPKGKPGDSFGFAVSASAGMVIIGAPGTHSGNPPGAGVVTIYDLSS